MVILVQCWPCQRLKPENYIISWQMKVDALQFDSGEVGLALEILLFVLCEHDKCVHCNSATFNLNIQMMFYVNSYLLCH